LSYQSQRDDGQLRVLVVRLGAMGDVLHALPALAALRERLPYCYLGWVIEPRWAPLLRTHEGATPHTPAMPLVDRVHAAHARGWARSPLSRASWRAMRTLRSELQAEHYDLAIDLQGAVRSALIGRASGARLVGEDDPRERPARWLFAQKVKTHGMHVIEQAAEVVAAATALRIEPLLPPLAVSTEAEAVIAAQWPADRPLAVLHPGAGWGAKRWPAERYGAVAAALSAYGYTVAVNGAPGEEALAAEVVRSSGGVARVARTDLAELIALTRRSALVVGGDTGPVHLGSALGKPVVGIFGPTDPARNGPYGVAARVLRHPASRRDHTRRSAPEAGLLSITVDEVLAAAHELMATGRPV
jgi:heptosyltransferase-1